MLEAYNGPHVVGWQFCYREKIVSCTVLMQQLVPPDMAVVNGHGAQSCYTHRELRMAHDLIQRLIIRDQLLTWMTGSQPEELWPNTISPL